MAIVDSIALCSTMRAGITLNDQAEAYSVVTRMQMDIDKLNEAAERIINLERMYNVLIGYNRENDTLPSKFLNVAMPKGESKGQTVNLSLMLDEYYDVMGWTIDGIPTKEKLHQLELNRFIDGI